MKRDGCLRLLEREIAPATGCTEPAAVALAAAAAAKSLGKPPERAEAFVSEDFYRNGMNACIPGSGGQRGLPIAAAIGAVRAKPEMRLELLSNVSREELSRAQCVPVTVTPWAGADRVYARVRVYSGGDFGEAVVSGKHDFVAERSANGTILEKRELEKQTAAREDQEEITIWDAVEFAKGAPIEELYPLREAVRLNLAIADEGLKGDYGIGVGRSLSRQMENGRLSNDITRDAVAVTAAAADARMAGCEMPVMSVAGSGNQGLTATLPVVVAARRLGADEETMLRALAMSALIAIHTKAYIGRLSSLCGCGISAALGACAAVTYLLGGGEERINSAINTMVADITGMVCDGAKPGCALKIATSVGSAFQAAMLAMGGGGAGERDGIVCADAEDSLRNLGRLGNEAMSGANRVILDMLDKRQTGG